MFRNKISGYINSIANRKYIEICVSCGKHISCIQYTMFMLEYILLMLINAVNKIF